MARGHGGEKAALEGRSQRLEAGAVIAGTHQHALLSADHPGLVVADNRVQVHASRIGQAVQARDPGLAAVVGDGGQSVRADRHAALGVGEADRKQGLVCAIFHQALSPLGAALAAGVGLRQRPGLGQRCLAEGDPVGLDDPILAAVGGVQHHTAVPDHPA